MNHEILQYAVRDYRYLLDRKYSQKSSIKLVGDRYLLKREERSILYRGVSDHQAATYRKSRLSKLPQGKRVYIDAYNILFTVGNYLNGRPVFISDDGFLRDAGELRGRFTKQKLLKQILNILYEFMSNHPDNEYLLYIDQPVSNSVKLAYQMNEFLKVNNLNGTAKTFDSPDYHIINDAAESDMVCTSDSVIIDKVPCLVFDLSFHLISSHFQADVFDLGDLLY